MEVFCRPAANPFVCAFKSISMLNNPFKYQNFFPDERVSFSDYLAHLLSTNFMFQCNLFFSKTDLKGSLYWSAVPLSNSISKAVAQGEVLFFFQFLLLLFLRNQGKSRETLSRQQFLGLS